MRVKAFKIGRYGPLLNIGPVSLGSFSVFYGRNEQGKTLTVDSLVKLLFKKERGVFERIDRVDEEPDGYLIIEDKAGKETKLPEKGDLAKVADIKAWEFRNTFVIRSSNLSLSGENEFYQGTRLTGLRTETIRSIREQLRELGKLTRADSSGSLSDAKDDHHLKRRVERARSLVKTTEELIQLAERDGLDNFEKDILKEKDSAGEENQKIGNLESAQKRERYEEGSEALITMKSALAELDKLQAYNDNDEQSWRRYDTQISIHKDDEKQLCADLQLEEKNYRDTKQNFENEERELQPFIDAKKKIDEEIRPEIKVYEMKSGKLETQRIRYRLFTIVAAVSSTLLLVSLFGAIIRQTLPFYLASLVFFILVLTSGVLTLIYVNGKASLAGILKRIKLSAAKFKLEGETIEEMLAKIQELDDRYFLKEKRFRGLERDMKLAENKINDLREKQIPDVRRETAEAERSIDTIRGRVKVQTVEEYGQKLQLKRDCQEKINIQAGILKRFGIKSETPSENLRCWEEAVNALGEFREQAKDIVYNEKTVEQLRQKLRQSQESQNDYLEQLERFSKQLNRIETEANDILMSEGDHLPCTTSLDMKAIKEKLQDFIAEVEENMNDTKEVMKIFEELESLEKEKISHLFGEHSPISTYFNEITDGSYNQVEFIPKEGKLEIRRADGEKLGADKLSSAAYDQLYLAIRLALGEKLLQGDKGFFIMDDPFVRADTERLQNQLDILKKISGAGWQIIYFTAKDEVRQTLRNEIKSGEVRYFEIKPTVAQTQSPAVLNSPSKSEQAKNETSQSKLFQDA